MQTSLQYPLTLGRTRNGGGGRNPPDKVFSKFGKDDLL